MARFKARYNPHSPILKDVSKVAFVLPQLLLSMIHMWPPQETCLTKLGFFIKLALMLMLEAGQFIYFVLNLSNITKLAAVMSTLSTTLQALVKVSIIFIHSVRLRAVIKTAYIDFWPSDFMGESLKTSLKATTTLVVVNMLSILTSALIFGFGFLTKPLIDGTMQLPFESWYPFDWSATYVYECIYVLQVVVNLYVIIVGILGHDFLYLALCSNIVAQYRLLKKVVAKLGSGEDGDLNGILIQFEGVEEKIDDGKYSQEKMLLVKCIEHHNKLLDISNDMEIIFSPSLFIQLATSMIAICVSSFLITAVEIDSTQLYHLTSYCLGHVLQLFIICAAGNELSHQSQTFGDYAFNNGWYLRKYYDIRKSLVMVIRRCERGSKITALGIFNLDYITFVSVMRLSFSFYTLLSSMMEKKNLK